MTHSEALALYNYRLESCDTEDQQAWEDYLFNNYEDDCYERLRDADDNELNEEK